MAVEEHANEIYTRAIYEMFCDELFAAGRFVISSVLDGGQYVVREGKFDENNVLKCSFVSFDGGDRTRCDCGFFEHVGIICRHSLKVGFTINL